MKFPKKLYVKIEGDTGEEYFDPHRAIDTTADAGERVKVGVYKLDKIVETRGSVTVVTAKPVRNR